MVAFQFPELQVEPQSEASVRAAYAALHEAWERADTHDGRLAVLREADGLRRSLKEWGTLARIHFSQATDSPDAKAERDRYDAMAPKLMELENAWVKRVVEDPARPELEAELGAFVFQRWESQLTTYDPAIESSVAAELARAADYTALLASARFEYRGREYNLSQLSGLAEDPDRQVRYDTSRLRWAWFDENGAEFDRIYDDLVGLRHGMARTLGYENFIDLGYRRMSRIGYGPEEVAFYRDQIREHVVPLVRELRRRQARTLGLDRLAFWDQGVHDPKGNPRPGGGSRWMTERAQTMFDEMDPRLGDFFRDLDARELLDLESRSGKAGGGYCAFLATRRMPFIFANFNGTKGDVEVFTHEMGHAYQVHSSRDHFPLDLVWATTEACEIHSMSLEFLTWPYMELFFGDDASRFRKIHLGESLAFLPYGVAVDHFQHLVYERPDATPAERHAMWREVEALYLPDNDYGDLPRLPQGGLWQRQLHIYTSPFYYIDYTLAQICALQFWLRAEEDRPSALRDYHALCERGGSASFPELVASAGLESPFEAGVLPRVAEAVYARL